MKLKQSIIVASILLGSTNLFGVITWNAPSQIAADAISNANQWAIEKVGLSQFSDNEVSVQKNAALSAKASINGQKTYNAARDTISSMGGTYGKEVTSLLESCFDIPSIPSFDLGFDLDGIDFCGIGDVNDIMGKAMKGKADAVKGKDESNLTEPDEARSGEPIDPKKDGSRSNCIEEFGSGCKEMKEKLIKEDLKGGIGKEGTTNTIVLKECAINNYYSFGNDTVDGTICVENSLTDGTTKGYCCRKDIVDAGGEYKETKENIISNNSKILDSNEDQIRLNVIEDNEDFIESATSRINNSRDMRNEYNMRFNPDTLIHRDPKKMKNGNSWYERNERDLKKYPQVYIIPEVSKVGDGDKALSINTVGLDTYKNAFKKLDSLSEYMDVDPTVYATRLGGITPLTSSILGYKAMNAVMANTIYKEEGKYDGEQGFIGREMAMINGLKGVMYQSMLITQSMDSFSRMYYNTEKNKFNKLSADNDSIKNKLNQMQQQNLMMINILKDISESLKFIEKKESVQILNN